MAAVASTSSAPQPQQVEQDQSLKGAIFQRLHPRVYLERFISEGVRPDGRAFKEWRDVQVNVGSISTADGSALVRLGDTTIVCGVKAEIAEPDLDREGEGWLVPNLDLPAICSPKFKPGPPTEEAQVLSDRLNEALLASNFLPLTSLCIEKGKSAWVLYVDATCINYDGNAFDAALLAMICALINTRLPKAAYNEETGRTICTREVMYPLQLNRAQMPLSMSFGVFDSTHVLADPTSFEEPLLDTTMAVVLGDNEELISVSQVGPGSTGAGSQDALMDCIAAAKLRRIQLADVIRDACDKEQ